MHPYLEFDMFGQMVEECNKVGIGVTAYFNAGLDHEMARKHREWTYIPLPEVARLGTAGGSVLR